MGLRAKAAAMAVVSSIRVVCCAATASGRKGSWEPSKLTRPSKPCASSLAAASPVAARSLPRSAPSIFMRAFYYEHPYVRDGLATVGGLLRESLRLAANRIGPGGGIPCNAADLDAAWLTTVLQPCFPRTRVRSIVRLGGNAGTTDRLRLGLTCDEGETGAAPPESVFVKLPPADLRTRLFVNLMRLGETEARFYRDLA